MTRAARAVIDVTALRHNLQKARSANPDAKQYAVIKANAYGHGMVEVASALTQANGFCVSSLEEARTLRTAGITHPILLLEGLFESDELPEIQRLGLEMVVHHEAQVAALESVDLPTDSSIGVWLKVDTGMHRLGFSPDQVIAVLARLENCSRVAQPMVLMTHLATADDFRHPATQTQLGCFSGLSVDTAMPRSIANSAGILGWLGSHADYDRPGIMLYGVSPFLEEQGAQRDLRPVMEFQSELIAVQQLKQGDTVGYGGHWTCPEDMPVGVVGVGYGDGYPRHAPNGTPVLVNGERAPLVGRVSMDMITVDLRHQPQARPGDPVTLWGGELPAEEVAAAAGTIAYELFCGVTARVPRQYLDSDKHR